MDPKPVPLVANARNMQLGRKSKREVNMGRWSRQEHILFLQALKLYGREWRSVQNFVKTRTSTQSRSHAQKFFEKLKRKKKTLEQFLSELDFDQVNNMTGSELEFEDADDMVQLP